MKKSVVVVGNVGSGKTSFVKAFQGNNPSWRVFFELGRVNPFLANFYSDPKRWCFASQMSFLSNSLEAGLQSRAIDRDTIQDWSVDSQFNVFAQTYYELGFLTDAEFMQLERINNMVYSMIPRADKYIYLSISPDEATKRISIRGRTSERAIGWIERLDERYTQFSSHVESSGSKIIHVDVEALDLRKQEDYEIIERLVKS